MLLSILQVFRKFSNSLGPDALEVLEGILDYHEIEDADVESSLETLAKEYNKQDGTSNSCSSVQED
jgi:DNA polymerase epsilon subunit 2